MERETAKKDNSQLILAFVLIAVGGLWLLRKLGFYIDFRDFFLPIKNFFSGWGEFLFSWQMIFIVVGLLLLAGKRSAGIVLIVIGGVFLIPKILFLTPLAISFLFPALLIGIGIAMVAKRI